MSETILIVDDDANLLAAMRRQLRSKFDVVTAASGEEAVALVKGGSPPAVILSDMRMTGLTGVETLRQVKEIDPDIIRLMLTGNADMQTAIDAINDGNIFRFLTKPCAPEILVAGLEAALQQHRLIVAERELLELTLAGSVKMLTDVLAMASPEGFRRANRISGWARKVAAELGMRQRWQLDLAAMLAPLGLVSLPDPIIAKLAGRRPLEAEERSLIESSPGAAYRIIANIPRLAGVAEIVHLQNRGFDGIGFPEDGPKGLAIPMEARLLKILSDLADICPVADPTTHEFDLLLARVAQYDPAILTRVRSCLETVGATSGSAKGPRKLPTGLLRPGMVLAADVVTKEGRLTLAAGMEIAELQVERLRNLAKFRYIEDEVAVIAT
jgi:response regulator RpfG family c-di-GMP phosphodiesterase